MGNLKLGYVGSVGGAMEHGLQLTNGVAAATDPATGLALWAASGVPQYRTSGANEGAGQVNYLHNRAATVSPSSGAYNLTTSLAQVVISGGAGTPITLTLPTAGTYLVTATVGFLAGNSGSTGDNHIAALYNDTDAAYFGAQGIETAYNVNARMALTLTAVLTVALSKVISLHAYNGMGTRGSVQGAYTSLSYVRLY